MVSIGVGSIVTINTWLFCYKQFIWSPANEKSKDALYLGLNYAAKDSTDAAINELTTVVKNLMANKVANWLNLF
jgi:hypothetical protein